MASASADVNGAPRRSRGSIAATFRNLKILVKTILYRSTQETLTLLSDGEVLIAGGMRGSFIGLSAAGIPRRRRRRRPGRQNAAVPRPRRQAPATDAGGIPG